LSTFFVIPKFPGFIYCFRRICWNLQIAEFRRWFLFFCLCICSRRQFLSHWRTCCWWCIQRVYFSVIVTSPSCGNSHGTELTLFCRVFAMNCSSHMNLVFIHSGHVIAVNKSLCWLHD